MARYPLSDDFRLAFSARRILSGASGGLSTSQLAELLGLPGGAVSRRRVTRLLSALDEAGRVLGQEGWRITSTLLGQGPALLHQITSPPAPSHRGR
jgi:hypothetical protein